MNGTVHPDPVPEKRQQLALNILAYKRAGLSDEAYRTYMTDVHALLVRDMMVKYGFVRWTMTHNTPASREFMDQIYDPRFANVADYDCVLQIVFPNIDCFVKMGADPFFREKVGPDHENFADTKRTKMTVGWVTEIITDGQVVQKV